MILALALRNPLQPISPRRCDKSHLLRLLLLHAFIKHEYRTASFLPREAREARHLVKSNLRQRMWTAIRDRLTRCSALPIKLESSKLARAATAVPDSGTLDARKYSIVLCVPHSLRHARDIPRIHDPKGWKEYPMIPRFHSLDARHLQPHVLAGNNPTTFETPHLPLDPSGQLRLATRRA
jgi:hypothetical protein